VLQRLGTEQLVALAQLAHVTCRAA
jgi:hypothetical protein